MIVEELFARLGLQVDEGTWAKGDRLIGGVKSALVGLGVALGLNSIKDMVMGVVELGGHLNDTAQKTGVAVEALQFYGYVAKLNSSSAEGITDGMTRLNKALGELAVTGKGPAADALKQLGIDFNSADFKKNSLDEKLQLISDKMAKLPDGPKKVAIAMDLFGRSGADLIPTLNDLGKNGDELRAGFEEMGGALTGDQTAALDEFGDNIDKTKTRLSIMKNQIVAGLLPVLAKLLEGFMAWVQSHREIIAAGLEVAVQALILAFEALGAVVDAAGEVWAFFKEHADLAKAVLFGIAVVILNAVVPALAAMALGWIEALAPILLVVAAGAAVFLVFKDIWESITTGKGVAATVWNFIVGKVKGAGSAIAGVAAKVRDGFISAWEGIKSAAEAAFEWIANLPVIKQLISVYKWFQGHEARQAAIQKNVDNFKYDPQKPGGLQGQYMANAFKGVEGYEVFGGGAATAPQITVTNEITVNPSTGMSEEDIARKVSDYGKNQMREAYDRVYGGRR